MYAPYTALNAAKEILRTIVRKWEIFVSLTGLEADFETVGVISNDNSVGVDKKFQDIMDGEVPWLTVPLSENLKLTGKFIGTGNAELLAFMLGKSEIDSTTIPGSKIIGISDKPQVPGKYLMKAESELQDGKKITVYIWKGQSKSESFNLAMGNFDGSDYTLQATPDYTKDSKERMGRIIIEDAA
jgi:hypothetical protein